MKEAHVAAVLVLRKIFNDTLTTESVHVFHAFWKVPRSICFLEIEQTNVLKAARI